MFSNRFNTKNDPLVEAVRVAQADGDLRRQAEAVVNEEFGVYSRKAVVRENLAAYDARLEEAYKCMKEGKPLDPVGKEDADVDNDGDSDKSDKYLLNRRKAIGKAMGNRMEEGSGVSGEDPGMEVAKQAGARQQAQTPSSTPARTGNAAGATIAKAKDALNELKKPTPKTAMDAYHRAYDSDVRSGGEGKRTARLGRWKQKNLPDKSARNQKDTGKAAKMNEAQIDEAVSRKHFQQVADLIKGHESQEKRNELASHHASIFAKQNPRFDHGRFHKAAGSTAHEAPKKMEEAAYSAKAAREGKDIGKPGKSFSMIAKKAGKRYGSEERGRKVAGAILAKIRAKHMKEENIQELSDFGKAFAAAKGQNFTFGGKSYSGARADAKPSTSGPANNPGLASAKGFPKTAEKPIGDVGYKSGSTVSLKPIGDTGTAQAAPAPAPAPRPAPIPGQKAPAPVDQADTIRKSGGEAPMAAPKVAPTPPSRPANLGGSSAPAKPMQNPDQNLTKVMKESVQVGENKYRIV